MKTFNKILLSLTLFTGLCCLTIPGYSQGEKLTRQEKKEVRKAVLARNFEILDSLINARSFVLSADFLQSRTGEVIPVVSTLNFIKVDKDRGTLQTGANSGMGYNGVGGVTAEGRIGTWKLTKDVKKQYYMLHFSLDTQLGNYDVFLTVSADNHASATISGLGP